MEEQQEENQETDFNLYWLKDNKVEPDVFHQYTSSHENKAIIIDNGKFLTKNIQDFINRKFISGSYSCRVGWENDNQPRLSFRNCFAKQRKDRLKKGVTTVVRNESTFTNQFSLISFFFSIART